MLTRTGLHALSALRFREAEHLYSGGFFSGAYYISGYAAELGLKACIARMFKADAIPDLKFVERIRSHRLDELVVFAELKPHLDSRIAADKAFATNWEVVRRWRPDDRYRMVSDIDSEDLLKALGEPRHGVLEWIRTHW